MKTGFRIFKLFAITVFILSAILFTASRLMQDKVSAFILSSLNRNISTKLQAESFRLSFLSKFPKASLNLGNVLVIPSPDFNAAAFSTNNTDTLLFARNVSVEFKITDILRKNYNIEKIRVRTGKVNLFTDSSGSVNYEISANNEKSETEDFTIDLQKIYLSDVRAVYNNLATKVKITGLINKGTLKSRIKGDNIGFSAVGELRIDTIQIYSTGISKPIFSEVDLDLQKNSNEISFNKGNLHMENFDIILAGTISSENIYDLKIAAHNIDVSKITRYLPYRYLKMLSEYDPSGNLDMDCVIKGPVTRTKNPRTEVFWQMKNGKIAYKGSDLNISNLSFTGYYSNGSGSRPETSILAIKDLRAKLGSAEYQGSLSLSRLNDPYAILMLKGKILPGEIKKFFNLESITEAGGIVDFDLKLQGKADLKEKFELSMLSELETEGELHLSSFCMGFKNNGFSVSDVNGKILISNTIRTKNLRLTYNRQKIAIDGEFSNLPEWLEGKPVLLTGKADVSFSRLIPEAFMKSSEAEVTSSPDRRAFKLPDDLALDINFKIDSLTYKEFSSSKISGTLNYKPKLLTFKSFNMKALNGTISGNGFILQNYNKSVLSKGLFNVKGVDINKAFTAFRNFGQNFLKAENIAGTLSGSLSVLIPLDSLLHAQINSITAEGKYLVSRGALINFEPVKQLSSFIELSELENISFEQMENDFFIRNNYLYIPQMQVMSSAVDLTVNGKHSLDNDYEYHVKVLLSEILSKKRKKNRHTVTEFGEVEDDGLGRTSMLLKIANKGEDLKVSYDMKAAASGVKDNFKSERKNLKTILNQEYGWFKDDTAGMQKPAEKKPRFKVSWDDNF